MKQLSAILGIYVLCLIGWPCQDEISDKISCSGHETHQDTNSPTQNDCHGCSPFCICSCCQANSLVSLDYFSILTDDIPIKITPITKTTNLSEIYLPVWLPPKVA